MAGSETVRVAIVHDWLVTWAGAERVLQKLLARFPQAEVFTTVNFLPPAAMHQLEGHRVHTSFIQRLPGARKHYRRYLPLMPLAVEQFDLKDFDLVISSSHAVAKGVITDPNQLHLCYCYTPMRYAWDMQYQYLRQTGNDKGVKSWLMRWQLHRLRQWDYLSAQRVDHFIAISHYIERRILRCYRRDAKVVYPPVNIRRFAHDRPRENFFITAGRMVPYKRFDIVADAFSRLPQFTLVVIGDGPELEGLKKRAAVNIQFLGYQSDDVLTDYLERARAFVFMAEEDFGILPVEAQAAGAPVIGYGKGGMAETVAHGKTGLLLKEQSVDSLIAGIQEFDAITPSAQEAFSAEACLANASRFSEERFLDELEPFFKAGPAF